MLLILIGILIGYAIIRSMNKGNTQQEYQQQQMKYDNQQNATFGQKVERTAEQAHDFLRGASPTGNGGIRDYGPSLRDEDGFGSACPSCGQVMVGFGRFGGYCSACKAWNYDRGAYLEKKAVYGPSADSLFILAAYGNVHCRTQGQDYVGILYIMPGSLIMKANNGKHFRVFFDEISAVSATKGVTQQLTILVRGDDTQPVSYNIDFKGASYDGAGGEDIVRIRQLIQER